MSGVTRSYSRAHRAFMDVSTRHRGVLPFDVRVLVALYEHDWEATKPQLRALLGGVSEFEVRRSLRKLVGLGLVVRSDEPVVWTLTRRGGEIAAEAWRTVEDRRRAEAA